MNNIIKKCISHIKKKDCCLNCSHYHRYSGECIYPDIMGNNKYKTGTGPLYYKCDEYERFDSLLFHNYIDKLIRQWTRDITNKYKSHIIMYNINYKHKKITIMTNIPDLMIGRRGALYNKYNEIFEHYGYKVILLEGEKTFG